VVHWETIGTASRTGVAVCTDARTAIREVVENWVLWRDAGDWDRFRTVWHDDGYMTATWFQGPAADFIDISRRAFENGVNILHLLSGTSIDVRGARAIAQTRMTILQRGEVDGVEVDVDCIGRFYDFFEERADRWAIVRRQPIYEKDRLVPLAPGTQLEFDQELLGRFPVGYRHLAYMQTSLGFEVKHGLPGTTGPAVQTLYAEGAAWLNGSDTPGTPL
jgi:hypothetical protein